MPNSSKPERPREDFPLTPRADGRWCKRINGKYHYFKGTAEEALAEYESLVESMGAVTHRLCIRDLCNQFRESKDVDVEAGQITQRTYDNYAEICDIIVAHFGKLRPLDELKPPDADSLRQRICKGVSLKTQSNRIICARAIFKFGVERMLMEQSFHTWIRNVGKAAMKKYQAQRPKRLINADEIRLLIDAASVQMQAMILLGINLGFGNGDCSALTRDQIDFETGWHDIPRSKNGEPRRGKMWPETLQALRKAIIARPKAKLPEHDDHVFLTRRGGLWVIADRTSNPLSAEFRKLAQRVGVYRPGVSFYSLRHMHETVGGGARDQVALNYSMGHSDSSMAAIYREGIEDARLEAIADHIRQWLYAGTDGGGDDRKSDDDRPQLRVVG